MTPDSNGNQVYHYHMPPHQVSALHFAARNGEDHSSGLLPATVPIGANPVYMTDDCIVTKFENNKILSSLMQPPPYGISRN